MNATNQPSTSPPSPSQPSSESSLSPTKTKLDRNWISENKTSIALVLFSVSCASLVASIRKRTRKTNDFGFQKILNTPGLRGNVQHASWIWAMQAFGISTALVGIGASGLALSAGYYYNVSSLKEFSVAFRNSIHSRFPSLAIPTNEKEEEEATREFMKEWKGDLEKEIQEDDETKRQELMGNETVNINKDEDHRHVISSIIADGLGPLGKYTRGGQR